MRRRSKSGYTEEQRIQNEMKKEKIRVSERKEDGTLDRENEIKKKKKDQQKEKGV